MGKLSILEGVAKSDNIMMAKLAIKMGADRMEHCGCMALDRRTGIILPAEQRGFFLVNGMLLMKAFQRVLAMVSP